MAVNKNQTKETFAAVKDDGLRNAPKKFVPKIRTPYLMQKEVIKQKKEASVLQREKSKKQRTPPIEAPSEASKGSQLVVNEESIGSQILETPRKEAPTALLAGQINFSEEVARLYGMQKKIAHFFVQCCIQRGQNNTGPVTADTLCTVTGSTKKTIKKILQRMVERSLVTRTSGKTGKGGFSIFTLDPNFIDTVRLQVDLEFNYAALSNQLVSVNSSPSVQKLLPNDWANIDLTGLLEALQKKSKNTQFFGKSQIEAIYAVAGKQLSATDVQGSINSFAYGLMHHDRETPYKSMINPAAVLLDTLKKGNLWIEKKYLSPKELLLYEIYVNASQEVDKTIRAHFSDWLSADTDKKYEHYQKKLSSTHFYDGTVFKDMAWEDYRQNLWPKERKLIIMKILSVSDENILDKFESIKLGADHIA